MLLSNYSYDKTVFFLKLNLNTIIRNIYIYFFKLEQHRFIEHIKNYFFDDDDENSQVNSIPSSNENSQFPFSNCIVLKV